MKKTILMIAVSLSGCSILPTERHELIERGQKSSSYCYAEPVSEITARVKAYLVECYRPFTTLLIVPVGLVPIPVPNTFNWYVEEEVIPSGTRFYIRSNYGYSLATDVTASENACQTEMRIFAGNQIWTNRFETLDKVAKNEKAGCPYPTRKPQ